MKRVAATPDQSAGKKRAAKRAKPAAIADVVATHSPLGDLREEKQEEEKKKVASAASDDVDSSLDSSSSESSSSSISSSSENNMAEEHVHSGDEDDGGIYLNRDKNEKEAEAAKGEPPANKGRVVVPRKKKAAPAKESSLEDEDDDDDDGDDDDDDAGALPPNANGPGGNSKHSKPGALAIGRFTKLCKKWNEQCKFPKNMVPNLYRLFRIIDRASQEAVNDYLADNDRPVVASFENDERKLDMTVQARAFINHELETKLTEITYLAGLIQDQASTERLDPTSIRQAIQSRPHLRAFDMEALLEQHTHMAPVINSILEDMLTSHTNRENNTIFLDYEHTLPSAADRAPEGEEEEEEAQA